MIKKTKVFIPLIVFASGALAATATFAAPIVPGNIPSDVTIIPLVRNIIRIIIIVGFVIAFIMLIVGGIRWILAGGDEKAVASARGTITAALIGLVIILVSFALIKLVETFFGIPILTGGVEIPTANQPQ